MQTTATEQRLRFAEDFESGQWSMTELCERYGVTRPTGYKWVGRFRESGAPGMTERSRAPRACPHRTPAKIEALILTARMEYGWGAKKLLQVLRTRAPAIAWPARSTVNDILERHGRLRKQRRRKQWTHPGAAPLETQRPNQVWPADFKGQFKTRDGQLPATALLPAHGHRSLQPDAPRVPRPVVGEDRGGEARIPRPVPRGRPPRSDPDRQRDTIRVDGHPRPVRVERVVDAARYRPSTDSSGESPGERDP